jgi:hypothetical protein
MDIPAILKVKYPDSEWILDGDEYAGLTWLSETIKPTQKQLEDFWPSVEAEILAKAQAKIDAKASAIAKLQALGLTVQEVEVAFGLTE